MLEYPCLKHKLIVSNLKISVLTLTQGIQACICQQYSGFGNHAGICKPDVLRGRERAFTDDETKGPTAKAKIQRLQK